MLKNSIVEERLQTEEGRKQLEKYQRLKTTEADINSLSKKFNIKINEK